ncbi:uncharacterized protein LOC124678508 [Lolium rigidum]|uniref:uncharacterized protein LOC124678508 n=1 Tax=Lolium rigidum TaxID=89674 RepID=UPI001F5CC7DB|nr:uncharacterized protein LOC124678508 [Lolium rigidum]
MLYSFLRNEPLKNKTKSKLTTSTKTVNCLVNMLGWTSERDTDMRLFAAKVTAKMADNLRVASVPGAMQLIASLLNSAHVQKMKDPLLDNCSPEPEQGNPIEEAGGNEQTTQMFKWLKQMAIYCFIPREEPTNMDEQKTNILRCCWKGSIPEEEPSTDTDLLPVLGMLILDKLASFDLENCIEISRAIGLMSKIIEFTSNQTDMTCINEIGQLKTSSLKVLGRLSRTEGEFGVTVRQKISEHPFLLSHLAEILDDSRSSQKLRKLTIKLLRNLAMDRNINQEIGQIPVIISKLIHAFLKQGEPSTTGSDQTLSGQALAILAMDSAKNCLAMLAEEGDVFIKELADMIKDAKSCYVASSLLRDICVHARSKLGIWNLQEISSILGKVLEGIMDAEGKGAELEVLVGLSSQICKVIPEDFARELEHGQIREGFIERLVSVLNTNTPTAHCPGIRRVIVEHAIYMMECNPGYANCFIECKMIEALLEVERKPSRAEKYKFFLGDAGLMEHAIPLSALVSKAKELMKP